MVCRSDRTEKTYTVRHQNVVSTIDYDMLVIATGARPIVPPFGEFNLNTYTH